MQPNLYQQPPHKHNRGDYMAIEMVSRKCQATLDSNFEKVNPSKRKREKNLVGEKKL